MIWRLASLPNLSKEVDMVDLKKNWSTKKCRAFCVHFPIQASFQHIHSVDSSFSIDVKPHKRLSNIFEHLRYHFIHWIDEFFHLTLGIVSGVQQIPAILQWWRYIDLQFRMSLMYFLYNAPAMRANLDNSVGELVVSTCTCPAVDTSTPWTMVDLGISA